MNKYLKLLKIKASKHIEAANYIHSDGHALHIICPKYRLTIKESHSKDFYDLNMYRKTGELISIEKNYNEVLQYFLSEKEKKGEKKDFKLGASLSNFVPYVSFDLSRIALQGVHVMHDRIEATNGHILKRKLVTSSKNDLDVIVPADFCKILDAINSPIFYYSETNVLYSENEDVIFECNAIEDSFPNVNKVIPSKYKFSNNLNTKELQEKIKKLLPFTEKKHNMIVFTDNKIIAANAYINFDFKLSKDFNSPAIAFNAKYLLQILNDLTLDDVMLEYNSYEMSFVIKNSSEIFLIMPLKLPEDPILKNQKRIEVLKTKKSNSNKQQLEQAKKLLYDWYCSSKKKDTELHQQTKKFLNLKGLSNFLN